MNDKYFKEKAKQVASKCNYTDKNLVNEIYLALKEVCKDTRHKCADLKVEYEPEMGHGFIEGPPEGYAKAFADGFNAGQSAHADACINIAR